jgi:hypothetical protein
LDRDSQVLCHQAGIVTLVAVKSIEFLAEVGVEERLDAQVIAGAEEALLRPVPDGEGEVAQQVLDTILSPVW